MPWLNVKWGNRSIFFSFEILLSSSLFLCANLWIYPNIGRSLAFSGRSCKCLWGWEAPDVFPPLKKSTPFNAIRVKADWFKSSRVRGFYWD